MVDIPRDPASLDGARFDVIIVGGGIYGAMLLLEATRAGLRALLLDRGDFGGETSSSHFRIGHGGLRYLQSLDLARFRESVRERTWLLQSFPDLVEPLPCLLPLYGRGLKRPTVMRAALAANEFLSRGRNRGIPPDRRLPSGRVVSPEDALARFPVIRREGLKGAALWYDASIDQANRVLIESIRWSCSLGAVALNYVGVTDVTRSGGRVSGVVAVDAASGRQFSYESGVIVNAAGPWVSDVARLAGEALPRPVHMSKAWNVVFDHPPLGDGALAIESPEPGARTYFLKSVGGKLFAGTGHAPCTEPAESAEPDEAELAGFVNEIDRAVPGLHLSLDRVDRVLAGFLPVDRPRSTDLSGRPLVVDHGVRGGLCGLISVCGVKYTTARRVAQDVLKAHVLPDRGTNAEARFVRIDPAFARSAFRVSVMGGEWREACESIIREEAVLCLEDLVERRTDLGDHPALAAELHDELAKMVPEPTPSSLR